MTTLAETIAVWRAVPDDVRAWLHERMRCQAMGHGSTANAIDAAIALLEAAAAKPAARSSKWPHVITIVLEDDGRVSGDLDDELALRPQCASEGEANSIDGQARSILSQALQAMLRQDLERLAELRNATPARLDAGRSAHPKTKLLAKIPIDGKCRDWTEPTHYDDEGRNRTTLDAWLHETAARPPADYVAEETMRLRAALKTAEDALEHIGKIGCMQLQSEPECFCKHDGSAHSIYCPKGIADEALTAIRAAGEGDHGSE